MTSIATLHKKILGQIASPLNVNAMYLFGATATSAAAGFIFWLLVSRFTNAASLGITSSMISSASLLKGFSDFGMSSAILYFGANDQKQIVRLVNIVIRANLVITFIITAVFLVGLPIWAPGLLVIQSHGILLIAFLYFSVIDAMLSVQDMAMLSHKKASYVFWRTVACNVPPFVLLVIITRFSQSFDALFLAYTIPNMVVVVYTSLIVLPREHSGYRLLGSFDINVLRRIFHYSSAVQLGNIIWSVPSYALPLIVINSLSPAIAGYFAINWQIVNFVLIIPRVVSTSMFVEGVYNPERLWKTVLQALAVILATIIPIALVLWLFGSQIIVIFGKDYINQTLLRVLLIGALPFSIDTLYFMMLRIQGRLKEIVIFSALIAGSVMISVGLLVGRFGVDGVALGWLLGYSLVGVGVCFIFVRNLSKYFLSQRG